MNKPSNVNLLVAKAGESLEVAQQLVDTSHYGFSVARSYYAMFYVAEAALLLKDLQLATHSGVIGSFAREFVKTGVFPPEMSMSLQKGFDLRAHGDYSLVPVSREDAENILGEAKAFVGAVSEYLHQEGYELE